MEKNIDESYITNGTFKIGIAAGVVIILIILLLYLYSQNSKDVLPVVTIEELREPEDESNNPNNDKIKGLLKKEYDPNSMKCLNCDEEYASDAIICLNCNKLFKWKDDNLGAEVWGKMPENNACLYCKHIVKYNGARNDAGAIIACANCGRNYIKDESSNFEKNDLYYDKVEKAEPLRKTKKGVKFSNNTKK